MDKNVRVSHITCCPIYVKSIVIENNGNIKLNTNWHPINFDDTIHYTIYHYVKNWRYSSAFELIPSLYGFIEDALDLLADSKLEYHDYNNITNELVLSHMKHELSSHMGSYNIPNLPFKQGDLRRKAEKRIERIENFIRDKSLPVEFLIG